MSWSRHGYENASYCISLIGRQPAMQRPPARPTSSPSTITEGSRASSTWNASLTASTIESSAKCPPQLLQVGVKRRGRVDVRMLEEERDVGRRLGLGGGDAGAQRVCGLGANRFREVVVQDPGAAEVTLEPPDALALAFL